MRIETNKIVKNIRFVLRAGSVSKFGVRVPLQLQLGLFLLQLTPNSARQHRGLQLLMSSLGIMTSHLSHQILPPEKSYN